MELAARGITRIEQDRWVVARNVALGLVVAGCVFALSYANGGFDSTTKAYAGISAWWLLGTGAAVGIATAWARVDRFALAALGLLSAFALWTLISMTWAPDGGRAFEQFNQVSVYVAVLAIAIVAGRFIPVTVIAAGVALAISAIAAVALVSRLFPSSFGVQASTVLPSLNDRLSFPLGYWNGLGIEAALAYPLLLAIMVSRRSRVASALAALPLPIIAADMYLTSSRGAFVAAAVAVVAFILLAPSRWPAFSAAVFAGGAGAIAVAILVHKNALVAGVMSYPIAVQQGHRAALELGVLCVASALVWAVLAEGGRHVASPPRVVGWATAAVVTLLAIIAVALSHPIAKFDAFKGEANFSGNSPLITQHLLSSSGSGRWQFWAAAISQFRAHPLNGGGGGSWEFWWLQHGSLPIVSQYAHSLYLEALAELGIVGFLLIVGAVVVAVVGAARSARVLRSGEVAAAAAAGIAFFAAAAYDWVWQLAGIAVVGVGLLGVALGARPATRAGEWARSSMLRPIVALLAVAAIIPQVVLLASGIHLRNSQAAVDAGDGARAKSEALAATAVEPWNAAAYLQLALVEERLGEYAAAKASVVSGIRRSRLDWRLWYAAVGIDAKRGDIAAARRDLAEVRLLYPNNPYLRSGV